MKKIRYLIIVIPVLVVMLFSQSNIHGFDFINWEPEHMDFFYIIDIDTETERVYLGYVSDNLGDSFVHFVVDDDYQDISNSQSQIGDLVMYSVGVGGYIPAWLIYHDFLSPGDKLWVVDGAFLSNGVETVILSNESSDVYFVYRKELLPDGAPYYLVDFDGNIGLPDWDSSLYDYAYNKGIQEERDYWNSIIDDLLGNEYIDGYTDGYTDGYLDALYANMDDLPTWVINSDLQLNDELYNYIDYDNLVFYENVGRLEVENVGLSSVEPEIITKRFRIDISDLNIADYDIYSTFVNSWGFPNRDVLNLDREGFRLYGSYIYFRINQDKIMHLGDTWNERITNYLEMNPLTITYELAEKQETIILQEELNQLPFYELGIDKGYIDGYGKGQADSKAIQGFIPTIIGAIWVVIANFMQFEVFGLSLWWILGIVVSLALAIIVLRLVVPNK